MIPWRLYVATVRDAYMGTLHELLQFTEAGDAGAREWTDPRGDLQSCCILSLPPGSPTLSERLAMVAHHA
eukprot:2823334-Pleurochrysis_carterae.AAC.1